MNFIVFKLPIFAGNTNGMDMYPKRHLVASASVPERLVVSASFQPNLYPENFNEPQVQIVKVIY